jgi:3-deoxy-D-manno-octulosonic-acid transferase
VSRTDTWPELLVQCHESGIPIVLFSATLGENNPKIQRPISRSYHAWLFQFLSEILCVSPSDQVQFESLGAGEIVSVVGDTRYDQVLARLIHPKPLKESLRPRAEEIVFIAGSTWPDDEEIILPALGQLLEYGVRPILAPHEPSEEHLKSLELQIKKLGLSSVLYSKTNQWNSDQILLIDRVGILAELYQWASIAFVGNSFRKHAIHSVMEPLAAGCITLMGPYHHNNREALSFKKISRSYPPLGFCQEFKSAEELKEKILGIINHPDLKSVQKEIQNEIRRRTGASLRVTERLESYLQNR